MRPSVRLSKSAFSEHECRFEGENFIMLDDTINIDEEFSTHS